MAAWQVPEARVESAGAIMAAFPQVSHCYGPKLTGLVALHSLTHHDSCRRRSVLPGDGVQMARSNRNRPPRLPFSLKELKKTSMEYFQTGAENG